MPDATTEEIKKAYYSCMKRATPTLISGDDPDVTNFCMFVNEVYTVGAFSKVLVVHTCFALK
jgi:hypothetical protein